MKLREIKKTVHSVLLVLTIGMVLTGLGIAEPGIIGPLTLGILSKLTSFRLHYILWGPFVIVLIIHVYLTLPRRM